MNIGKVAKFSGLTVKTVRYCSNIELINPQVNSKTGYRDFSESDLAKLQFLAKARKFDFSFTQCFSNSTPITELLVSSFSLEIISQGLKKADVKNNMAYFENIVW